MTNPTRALLASKDALILSSASLADCQADVMSAIEIVDSALQSLAPPPNPRPVLPSNISVVASDQEVYLTWDFPLPAETPGVEVQRASNGGWTNLAQNAQESFLDSPPQVGPQQYRIRGFNRANAGGVEEPKASPWSATFSVVTSNPQPPGPGPGPGPDPEPSEYRALDRADKSSSENKLWRAPDMLASRTGRTNGTVGDIRRGQWTQGDLIKEDLTGTTTSQWHSNMHVDTAPRPGNYVWRNIECRSAVEDVWATKNLWGAREHYVPERLVEDCDFAFMKEHGLYISPQEGSTVRRSTFVNVGAQGLQYAHRPVAKGSAYKNNHSYSQDPVYIVDDCHMIDCGRFAGRGSFSLTYFTCGNVDYPGTFKVSNSSFVANWDQPNNDYFGDYHSTGAMVVTAGSWEDGSTWTGGCQTKLIELTNNLYDYTTPDRSILSLRSFEDLVITDCVFIVRDNSRGKACLKVDSYVDDPTIKSKRITLRNVYAPGQIGKVQGAGNFSMHCPGEEIKIDARTGNIVSRRPL